MRFSNLALHVQLEVWRQLYGHDPRRRKRPPLDTFIVSTSVVVEVRKARKQAPPPSGVSDLVQFSNVRVICCHI